MEGSEKSSKNPDESNSSKFECNICFDDVKDPVVTRCGHLFCWSCILSWMNRNNRQCPMCQAEISKKTVIPLYGHGQTQSDPRNKPEEPRPKAQRPTSQPRENSFFRGYEGRVSVAFGSFPFSFIFPIAFGGNNGGSSFFSVFRRDEYTDNMTPEERRAYGYTAFFTIVGLLLIVYLVLCV